jgi:hypothetical protein
MASRNEKIEKVTLPWRIFTPFLLLTLTVILSMTGYFANGYLNQIINTMNEIKIEVREFITQQYDFNNGIEHRVTVIETKVNGNH